MAVPEGEILPLHRIRFPPRSRDVVQINLALTDLKTGTVVARASSRARDEGVDTTPTAYYRDSPILVKDQVTRRTPDPWKSRLNLVERAVEGPTARPQ